MISMYNYAVVVIAAGALWTSTPPMAAVPTPADGALRVVIAAPDTVRLKIEGMTCGGCAVSARIVLQRLNGVVKADVDYDTKVAVVIFYPKIVSSEQMIQALKEKLKYTATVLAREESAK